MTDVHDSSSGLGIPLCRYDLTQVPIELQSQQEITLELQSQQEMMTQVPLELQSQQEQHDDIDLHSTTDSKQLQIEIEKLSNYLNSLKSKIKAWEHSFMPDKPTQSDIKSNNNVAKMYKNYQKYKKIMNDLKVGKLSLSNWKDLKHSQKKNDKLKSSSDNAEKKPTKHKKSKDKKVKVQTHEFVQEDQYEDEDEDEDQDDSDKEIGPTPQLHGRVLGVFDIELKPTPQSTPVKKNPLIDNNIEFVSPLKATPRINRKLNDVEFITPSKKVERKLLFGGAGVNIETPKKQQQHKVDETPGYMKVNLSRTHSSAILLKLNNNDDNNNNDNDTDTDTDNDEIQVENESIMTPLKSPTKSLGTSPLKIEPSPILRRNLGKSLFQINNELSTLKKNLKFFESETNDDDDDDDEVKSSGDEAIESPLEVVDDIDGDVKIDNKLYDPTKEKIDTSKKRSKTMKRTTKRVKLKTVELSTNDDEFDNINIHDKIKEMDESYSKHMAQIEKNRDDLVIIDNGSDNDDQLDRLTDDDDDDSNEVYKRREHDLTKDSKKTTKGHPLSNNFVKYKIHKRKGGGNNRFSRR
ncbi:hypothetical protein CANARDRAFT_177455 [[Candida] arabinofermentans NRRL YB-2248]|uniref:DNA replication regulator SLD2 n=1 Tax=[Candida] arabinofermentans NRRL YB-2248 TaxID=983967 RepID=A0A1E4SW84_9ASCO|nr:hypothetical protein CANARDRAFT_177455 [[Candida] arabinofermentans NRRL YB-2248]